MVGFEIQMPTPFAFFWHINFDSAVTLFLLFGCLVIMILVMFLHACFGMRPLFVVRYYSKKPLGSRFVLCRL